MRIPSSKANRISLAILATSILLAVLVISVILPAFNEELTIIDGIEVFGSIFSTAGFIIALIQILELQKTSEATKKAVQHTERELAVTRAIESATNCFNDMNSIDDHIETNNFDSIKSVLHNAIEHFHGMTVIQGFEVTKMTDSRDELTLFLENFATKLTIWINQKNSSEEKKFKIEQSDLEPFVQNIQRIKTFASKYKNSLQSSIVKDDKIIHDIK